MSEWLKKAVNNLPYTKGNLLSLISSIVLACFFDILFFNKTAGISYPLFIIACYVVLYLTLKKRAVANQWVIRLPGVIVVVLSLTFFLFSNELLRQINLVIIPLLFFAHAIVIVKAGRHFWFQWNFFVDILAKVFGQSIIHMPKLLLFSLGILYNGQESSRFAVIKRIAAGVLLAIPILSIIIWLLASADYIFYHLLAQVKNMFDLTNLFKHTLLISVAASLIFGFIWSLATSKIMSDEYRQSPKKLDEIIVLTILALVNIIYILFCCIQFTYLFDGMQSYLPEGFTHAEYARRGFFELVIIALCNITMVVGSMNYTNISGKTSGRLFKAMTSALIICTLILLVSAFCRMSLYELEYGYTYLRVFTQVFMGMIFLMFCMTLIKIWSKNIILAQWYIAIALSCYVLLNYANVDVLITEKNLDRYYNTGKIDVDYLASMSYDTTPYLERLQKDENQKVSARATLILIERKAKLSEEKPWQSYNMSVQKAKSILDDVNFLQ